MTATGIESALDALREVVVGLDEVEDAAVNLENNLPDGCPDGTVDDLRPIATNDSDERN